MDFPEDGTLREYALPSSPCRSPTGSDAMSVWVEEASDGKPRVRVALTDDIARTPRALACGSPTLTPTPEAAVEAPKAVDFPLELVGESRAIIAHANSASAAIVPFQKLQLDTDLHLTTLPSPTNQRGSGSNSPSSNGRIDSFGNAFHGGDAMAQNFIEAMRLGDMVARPQEPQLSVRLRGNRVELASGMDDDAVDFLGPAENIKKLFKLPYSQGPVSLAVHRVGTTLVVDGGIDDVDLPPGFGEGDSEYAREGSAFTQASNQPKSIGQEQKREEESQQILYEKFIYQSTVSSRLLASNNQDHESGRSTDKLAEIASKRRTFNRRSKPKQGESKPTGSNRSPSTTASEEDSAQRSPWSTSMPRNSSRSAFQRVLKWKFSDLKMVLGSDVMLFSNPEHPAVSLRLHDMDKELSLATVLDYYLDNVIANIPELAICMHSKGVVRGYKLVETRQIPYMSGDASRPLFDVQEVSLNAAMLLKFLKNNCTRPNGTYWLHRKQGENALRLYDVNVLSQGKQLKWKYMMAMLCYRFASRASRMMYSLTTETPGLHRQLRLRQRDLLRTCVNLLKEISDSGGAAHSSIRSSVAEQLADTYLQQGNDELDDDSDDSCGDTNSTKADALVHAEEYLRESIRLFEECIQLERDSSALPRTEDERIASRVSEHVEISDDQENEADDGGVTDFMSEELERLQLKCSSINLHLARIRLDEAKWEDAISCIQNALVHAPRGTDTFDVQVLSWETGAENDEIDRALESIDFDGVRRKEDSCIGGTSGGGAARVCATVSELRCFLLEVIGDAASKQSDGFASTGELLHLYETASGQNLRDETSSVLENAPLTLRQIAFFSYLRGLFPSVDSELYFRLMKKLGNACNELGKYYLSVATSEEIAYIWFERSCRIFNDIEDTVNVALLSANLAHLHKILAQREIANFQKQQQHYGRAVDLCMNAASLLKHHKMDDDAALYTKVNGELALSYLVWGVALANSSDHRNVYENEAQKKFSKALALYTELGDIKQTAATHYQVASFYTRQISREATTIIRDPKDHKQTSGLKNRMEIARRHYEKALEYFGRNELGATFILIHQELADLYALGGRLDDLDHALLVLLNTVHAFKSSHQQVLPLAPNVLAKIQATVHQLIRLSTSMSSSSSIQPKRLHATRDESRAVSMIDAYKRMYKELLYFSAEGGFTDMSLILGTLQSIYDDAVRLHHSSA